MSRAEIRTMGTTGRSPSTSSPTAVRSSTTCPASVQSAVAWPGGGAGTEAFSTPIANTPAATHSVEAKAPHFVLPRQNSAAISSGDSAAKPVNAYWTATVKMLSGRRRAMTYATTVRPITKARPVWTWATSPKRSLPS